MTTPQATPTDHPPIPRPAAATATPTPQIRRHLRASGFRAPREANAATPSCFDAADGQRHDARTLAKHICRTQCPALAACQR